MQYMSATLRTRFSVPELLLTVVVVVVVVVVVAEIDPETVWVWAPAELVESDPELTDVFVATPLEPPGLAPALPVTVCACEPPLEVVPLNVPVVDEELLLLLVAV